MPARRGNRRPPTARRANKEDFVRDQLATVIQGRVGLDEPAAQQAVGVAIDFIKAQCPPELAPILEGQPPNVSDAGGLVGKLFGRRPG